ncbi:hypothetical protein BDZ91DRAFT_194666 [Kalaharituber pfeilii]|nr:hypothetical protein BDZ91DRAFT_194666 [Kalaharituber pfeilii]
MEPIDQLPIHLHLLLTHSIKHITLSEEKEDLRSLGLTHCSLLVLILVSAQHSNAYPTLASTVPSP